MYNYLIQESAIASPVTNIVRTKPNTIQFTAVLQEADEKNRNGRLYPKKVLEEALKAPYIKNMLENNTLYGEAGHPLDMDIKRQASIAQSNIAFLIHEMWWEGNRLMGKCETANTAIGRDMQGLIEQGSRVAFSLRAQGNFHYDPMLEAKVIDAPLNIVTWDWVVNPSHQGAYLQNICEETLSSLIKNNGNKTPQMCLTESVSLYENGMIYEINESVSTEVIDYASCYGLKFKTASQHYNFNENDSIVSVSDDKKTMTLKSGNVYKKVISEDYITKDIRNRIRNL